MALRFIGVDPNTPNTGSPTVWVDEEDGSLLIQGWKITDDAAIGQIESFKAIPDHETVVRIPARMKLILKDAIGDI